MNLDEQESTAPGRYSPDGDGNGHQFITQWIDEADMHYLRACMRSWVILDKGSTE